MSKRGYKDHFGNSTAQFDRINKFNQTEKVDNSIAGQLKRLEAIEKQEAIDAEAAKVEAQAKKDKKQFAGWSAHTK